MVSKASRRAVANQKAQNTVMAGPALQQPVYYMPGGSYGVSGVNKIRQNPLHHNFAASAMETTKRIRSVANPSQFLYDSGFEREAHRPDPLTHRLHVKERYSSRECVPLANADPCKMPQLSTENFNKNSTSLQPSQGSATARGMVRAACSRNVPAAGHRGGRTFLRGQTPERLSIERSVVASGLPQATRKPGGVTLDASRSTNRMNDLRIESMRPF